MFTSEKAKGHDHLILFMFHDQWNKTPRELACKLKLVKIEFLKGKEKER